MGRSRPRRSPARRTRRRPPHRTSTGLAVATLALIAAYNTWPAQTLIAAAVVLSAAAASAVHRPTTQRIRARLRPTPGRRPTRPRTRARRVAAAPRRPTTRRPSRLGADLAAYRALDPTAFEHAIADLARTHPTVATATRAGGAGDRALDVLVTLHDGRRILIQCKRYTGNVGAPALYEVNGTYRATHRCQMAVVVTTAGFTRSALEWNASLPPAERLRLIDGARLMAWARGGPPPWA